MSVKVCNKKEKKNKSKRLSVNSRHLLEGISAFTGRIADAIIVPRFQDQRVTLLLFSVESFRHYDYSRFRIHGESALEKIL